MPGKNRPSTAASAAASTATETTTINDRVLLITRVFNAPPALVFKAWTQREHILQWLAPHGFTITQCDGDLRPGGRWHESMHSPDHGDLPVGGVYREIIPDERLVFTHAWEDEDARPKDETLVTVTFAEHGAGQTLMTFRQEFFQSVQSRDGHSGGWTECFERLAALLEKI